MNQFFNQPFQHWVQDDFLPADLLKRADQAFQSLGDEQFLPHVTGYRFAICQDPQILQFLYSAEMKAKIEFYFGRKVKRSHGYPVPQYYDYPLETRGLPPHTDADEARDVAMIIYLNDGWQPGLGGELVVMHSALEEDKALQPLKNRMACLELHPTAWHAVKPTRGSFQRRTLIVDWDFC